MNLYNEDLLARIDDIFRKDPRKPDIDFLIFEELDGIRIDMPRKQKGLYHGSSYQIGCNKPRKICNIGGDLVVKRKLENITKQDLEKLTCEISDIHRHTVVKETEKFPIKESHIHFRCGNKNPTETLKIINKLKNY